MERELNKFNTLIFPIGLSLINKTNTLRAATSRVSRNKTPVIIDDDDSHFNNVLTIDRKSIEDVINDPLRFTKGKSGKSKEELQDIKFRPFKTINKSVGDIAVYKNKQQFDGEVLLSLGFKLITSYVELRHNRLLRPKVKRKRNSAFDLVGIESNPGPNKSKKSKQSKTQKKQQQTIPVVRKVKNKNQSIPNQNSTSTAAALYLRSVLQPCVGGARIPDMTCIPTGIFTCKRDLHLTTSANGVAGIFLNLKADPNYNEELSTSTNTTFAHTSVITLNSDAINLGAVRVVSACIDVQFAGSTQTDQGLVATYSLAGYGATSESLPTDQTTLLNLRSNKVFPLREGASVFYRPIDPSSFEFRSTANNQTYGYLGFHVSGAATGQLIIANITVNLEYIPKSDSSDRESASHTRSPVDIVGHSQALASAATVPQHMNAKQSQSLVQRLESFVGTVASVYQIGKTVAAMV